MLGKGLESLIPPNKGANNNGGTNGDNTNNGDANYLPKEDPVFDLNKKDDDATSALNFSDQFKARKEDDSATNKGERRRQEAIFQIEVEKIKPNPHQPRKDFDNEALKDLAASIREVGILQPLVVTKVENETPIGTDVEYILIAGERRLMAAKLLGLERVPAIVKRVDFERERLEMAIIENLQREDLSPIETARAFSRLQDEFNLTQREIATRLGKSREAIANSVRLLDLPAYIQEALGKNLISETHGRLLLAVQDAASQKKLFDDIISNKLTTRELKEKVSPSKPQVQKDRALEELPMEVKYAQEKIASQLGAPVAIEKRGDKGRILISFYSEEELMGILERLEKETGGF